MMTEIKNKAKNRKLIRRLCANPKTHRFGVKSDVHIESETPINGFRKIKYAAKIINKSKARSLIICHLTYLPNGIDNQLKLG
jgi:hypothetical protein